MTHDKIFTAATTALNTYHPDGLTIYLLRHGETHLNAQGVLQGTLEAPLNANGRSQAARAAEQLAGLGIQRIVTSPQLRARQTADLVAQGLSLDIEEHPMLRERNWGAYEGKPRHERDDEGTGVESYSSLSTRAQEVFFDIAKEPCQPVLVVTHSGLIKALLHTLGCVVPDQIGNGEIIKLTADSSPVDALAN